MSKTYKIKIYADGSTFELDANRHSHVVIEATQPDGTKDEFSWSVVALTSAGEVRSRENDLRSSLIKKLEVVKLDVAKWRDLAEREKLEADLLRQANNKQATSLGKEDFITRLGNARSRLESYVRGLEGVGDVASLDVPFELSVCQLVKELNSWIGKVWELEQLLMVVKVDVEFLRRREEQAEKDMSDLKAGHLRQITKLQIEKSEARETITRLGEALQRANHNIACLKLENEELHKKLEKAGAEAGEPIAGSPSEGARQTVFRLASAIITTMDIIENDSGVTLPGDRYAIRRFADGIKYAMFGL